MFDAAILEQFLWYKRNHDKRDDYTAAQFPILCGELFGFVARLLNGHARQASTIRMMYKEIERLAGVVERLGSSEAFVTSRYINPIRDEELLARMDFARSAINVENKPRIILPN